MEKQDMLEDQDDKENKGKDNFPNENQQENKEDNMDGIVVTENDEKNEEKEADKQVRSCYAFLTSVCHILAENAF